MKCPFCQSAELKVLDSREASEINGVRRRRECLNCAKRFTTFETVELTIQVHKRDGRYEEFRQQKLVEGMMAACRHTTISGEHVLALASEITSEFIQRQTKAISTTEIGEIIMQRFLDLDPIAYIRFACVYRRFKNIEELLEAVQSIEAKDNASNPYDVKK